MQTDATLRWSTPHVKQAILIYDGDCGVCTYLINHASKIDRKNLYQRRSYQSFTHEDLKQWNLSPEKCAHQIYVLSSSGKTYGGAFAVNHFFWQFWPWKGFVFLIYALPFILFFEIIGYKVFARNRHIISKWMGLQACSISSKPHKR